MIKEKNTGEVYKSKAAMKKHEAKESPAKQKAEGYMSGGAVSGKRGKTMVASPGPPAPMVVKEGSAKLAKYATGGAAKMKPHSTSRRIGK